MGICIKHYYQLARFLNRIPMLRRLCSTVSKKNLVRNFSTKSDKFDVFDSWKLYKLSPPRVVPAHIPRPGYVTGKSPSPMKHHGVRAKTKEEVDQMRKAAAAASYIREFAGKQVQVGITTDEIDRRLHEECIRIGIYPSALGYYGFPKSVCTSVNNVVCHGIPDMRPLENGDIINIDVTVFVDGYHGDCSAMFVAGETSPENQRLIAETYRATHEAIKICGPGVPFREIGRVIHEIADENGYGTIRNFTGHGIGTEMHQPPHILHYRNNEQGVMKPGMTFTIEPMFTMSGCLETVTLDDDWTIITADGSWAAQWEQIVHVTEDGAEILTQHQPGQFA